MAERHWLCRADELPDPGSRGFSLDLTQGTLEIVLVKRRGALHAYRNRCPHTGVNLEWQPDRFLDLSGCYIQCATHGALFRPEDGLCLRGPCVGQRLERLRLEFEGADVHLLL